MTDVNPAPDPPPLPDEALHQGMEMLFYAYREFTAEADTVLRRLGFGRAHHRAIYFVGRHPEISVTGLLAILGITKQSLARVLGELVRDGFIAQTLDAGDRRRRLLRLAPKGVELERQLSETQRQRVAAAYAQAGDAAVAGFRAVMAGLMSAEDRAKFGPAGDRPPRGDGER